MRSLGYPSIQWGLIFGIAASIVTVLLGAPFFSYDALTAILQGDRNAIASFNLLWYAAQFAFLVIFVLAGVLASRETGTLAGGMWAAAIASLASYIMTTIFNIIIVPNTRLGNGVSFNAPNYTNGAMSSAVTLGYLCGSCLLLFVNGAAAAVGALPGAWFGRWLYERGADDEEDDEYEEVPYPGAMPGGYPVFPQQGMPPQQGYMPPQPGGWGGPPPGYADPPPGYGAPPPGYGPPPPGYGPPPGPQGYPPQPPPRRH